MNFASIGKIYLVIEDRNTYDDIENKLGKVFLFDLFDKKRAKGIFNRKIREHAAGEKSRLLQNIFLRAAVVLVAILSGAIIHSVISNRLNEGLYAEVSVPPGQMTLVKLPDGSQAWLNSGTTFKYPVHFGRSSREVFLDGEAYLSVAYDGNKPFTLFANDFSVRVLGTSFNVDAYSKSSRSTVTLVDGSIILNDNDKSWHKELSPGQMATIGQGNAIPEIANANTDFYTSWREGKVVFKSETFEEIAYKLERWYNVEISFEDPELKKFRFSGTFLKYKPIEQVFSSICIMNPSIDFKMEERTENKNKIKVMIKKIK